MVFRVSNFLVFLALFVSGMQNFLLIIHILGTGMWNGLVIIDFLVDCLLFGVLMSCKTFGK